MDDHRTSSEKRLVIVTLSRDNPQELRRTIESVLAQNVQPCTHLVIDSSSAKMRDEAMELVQSSGGAYVWCEPSGIFPAMQKSLELLERTDYVWFLNSGDVLATHKSVDVVRTGLNALDQPEKWLVGDTVLISGDKSKLYSRHQTTLSPKLFSRLGLGFYPHPSTIALVGQLRDLGGFDLAYQVGADYLLSLRLVLGSNPVLIHEPISIHYLDGNSQNRMIRSIFEESLARLTVFSPSQLILEIIFAFPRAILRVANRALASLRLP